MHKQKTIFHPTKAFLISAIAVSLAACSTGTESTNSPTSSASSPPTYDASSSSPQTANSPASVAIPGVNNVGEIKFQAASKSPAGFFDAVNNSSAPTIEVPKATPLNARGWAVYTDVGRIPDRVIITYGDNNSLVAVAPVNLDRPDVVKILKNPAYRKSGWSATFNPSTLPAGKVVLKAWAYNSARKEATQLNSIHQVVVLE